MKSPSQNSQVRKKPSKKAAKKSSFQKGPPDGPAPKSPTPNPTKQNKHLNKKEKNTKKQTNKKTRKIQGSKGIDRKARNTTRKAKRKTLHKNSLKKTSKSKISKSSQARSPQKRTASRKIKKIKHPIVALTAFGLEKILAKEVALLGGQKIETRPHTVAFTGDTELLYRANIELRTAIRVLWPLFSFPFQTQEEYYYKIRQWDWPSVFRVRESFAIEASGKSPVFPHSQMLLLKAKDAIVDRFRHDRNARPPVNREEPDFLIHLHVYKNTCTVSLDSSGPPLNRRGYRSATGAAPLNETLAAGLVLASNWDYKNEPLIDPMCGSGTIPIEAALYALNIAPGLLGRSYAFQKWRTYKPELFERLIEEARKRIQNPSPRIYAREMDAKVLKAAEENMKRAGVLGVIDLKQADFFREEPPKKEGLVVINPPYGERLRPKKIGRFYKDMGDRFSESYENFRIFLLSSNEGALESLGLNILKDTEIQNGPLKCRLQELRV